MKKITVFLAGLFILSLAMVACKKDYTCECVIGTTNPPTTHTYTITATKKADAKATCDAMTTVGVGSQTCTLK